MGNEEVKVKDVYPIDEQRAAELSTKDKAFQPGFNWYMQVKDEPISKLSAVHKQWLTLIQNKLAKQ